MNFINWLSNNRPTSVGENLKYHLFLRNDLVTGLIFDIDLYPPKWWDKGTLKKNNEKESA